MERRLPARRSLLLLASPPPFRHGEKMVKFGKPEARVGRAGRKGEFLWKGHARSWGGGERGGGGERRPREDDVAAKEERDKETDADNEKTSEERRLE